MGVRLGISIIYKILITCAFICILTIGIFTAGIGLVAIIPADTMVFGISRHRNEQIDEFYAFLGQLLSVGITKVAAFYDKVNDEWIYRNYYEYVEDVVNPTLSKDILHEIFGYAEIEKDYRKYILWMKDDVCRIECEQKYPVVRQLIILSHIAFGCISNLKLYGRMIKQKALHNT